MCCAMLAQGAYEGEIKRAVAKHFGISPRTFERYLRRARDLLNSETGKLKIEHRAESLAFYQSVRRTSTAALHDRLRAQERIDRLLGLEAPAKQEHFGPGGRPIPAKQDVTVSLIDRIDKYTAAFEAAADREEEGDPPRDGPGKPVDS